MGFSGFQLDLHSRNSGCFVISSIQSGKWIDSYFSTKQITSDSDKCQLFQQKITSEAPHYISVNTFKGKRSIDNVLYLNSFYVDIDCGHGRKAYALSEIYKNIRSKAIPPPNKIVDSGRGYHIYWHIHQIAKTEKHDYKIEFCAFQKYLTKTLEYIGADYKAIDPARVLRLEGSLNSKTDTRVTTVHSDTIHHNFFDLVNAYLGTKDYKSKNSFHKSIEKNTDFRFSKLHHFRLQDYKTIIHYFNTQNILTGYRELLLFFASLSLFALFKDIGYIFDELNNYNDLFVQKLRKSEIQAILVKTDHYQKTHRLYIAKNETIIKNLILPDDLQKILCTLIGREEKYRRLTEKRRQKGILERSIYLNEKESQAIALLSKIYQLKENGKNNSQIAKELGYTRQYISKLLKMSTGLSL